MKENVYVHVDESPSSGYISINRAVAEGSMEDLYRDVIKNAELFGFRRKAESFEGFKLQHVHIEVSYDGRKGIKDHDILQSLTKQGLAIKKGESMFGGFYLQTSKLRGILENQIGKRKELINDNKYKIIELEEAQ